MTKLATSAKIFQNGRSLAIRLPKEFRLEGKEVYIRKVGQKVILSVKPESWKDFFTLTKTNIKFYENKRTTEFRRKRPLLMIHYMFILIFAAILFGKDR